MAYTIIKDTNSISSNGFGGHGIDLAGGDGVFVLAGGSIVESGVLSIGVEVNGANTNVKVDGLIYATNVAIDSSAQSTSVTVNGEVISDLYAMYLNGDGDNVTIGGNGQVEGSLVLTGAGSRLNNNGLVTADDGRTAVYLGSSSILNAGTIGSLSTAVHFQGTATAVLTNTGTIIGGLTEETMQTGGALQIYNTGLWTGGDLQLTINDDLIVNSGTITDAMTLDGGNDTYDGSNGHIYGTVDGDDGNDTLKGGTEGNTFRGGAGADTIDGGGGSNTAQYNTSTGHVVVNLAEGTAKYGDAAGDKLSHIQNIDGSFYNDKLTGDAGDNVLNGVIGKDTLTGNDGNDTLIELGGSDRATISGGNGNDLIKLIDFNALSYGQTFGAGTRIDGGTGFDIVELKGDYSQGVSFNATTMVGVEYLQLDAGYSYKFTSHDATVAAGQTLEVDASQLDSGHTLTFNGAAETNGKFIFDGGDGKDTLIGGSSDDTFTGGLGLDKITSGLGHDTFVYNDPLETGLTRDTITDFDANNDAFSLPVAVTGIDAAVTGSVSTANFANSVANTVAGHLLADHAILLNATGGNLSGHTLLIVDANGIAGYQSADDYLFDVTGMTGTLMTSDFITG